MPTDSTLDASAVFLGFGAGGQQGVYKAQPDGPPQTVADPNTTVPGNLDSKFTQFVGTPAISGPEVDI